MWSQHIKHEEWLGFSAEVSVLVLKLKLGPRDSVFEVVFLELKGVLWSACPCLCHLVMSIRHAGPCSRLTVKLPELLLGVMYSGFAVCA